MRVISRPAAGDMIRRLLLAWLLTGAIQYTCLPASKRVLSGFSALTGQSFPLLLVGTAVCFVLLTLAGLLWRTARWERAALPLCFGWQLVLGLCASWSVPLLCAGLVVLALLLVYAAYGARMDGESLTAAPVCTGRRAGLIIVIIAAAVFLVAVLALTVFRVLSYAAPTYDFGIFSQMFHSMRTTGLPVTTCERDRVLSHFAVHVSPIYYLFLPFYALFPSPVTLEVLQALLLASAVIPLWRIARRHGLSGVTAGLLCALLLLWPAYAGGTSYDVHENKFLTPLLLWLFDFLDRRCVWGIALFSVLTCMVKEDAPVYVAVIALWVVLRALTRTGAERRWGLLTGGAMLVGAVGYFLGVTAWLAADGDGVMSYRYSNFLYDGSDSLFTVIKAVLLSPVRTLRECFEGEKIAFFFLTMGPLLFLPLCTRRYERAAHPVPACEPDVGLYLSAQHFLPVHLRLCGLPVLPDGRESGGAAARLEPPGAGGYGGPAGGRVLLREHPAALRELCQPLFRLPRGLAGDGRRAGPHPGRCERHGHDVPCGAAVAARRAL